MAELETQGQVQEFLDIVKKRRWQVLLPVVFLVALGCAAAVIVPRKYAVKTRIELRAVRVEDDYQFRNTRGAATKRELGNAQWQVKHYQRVRRVIESELRWSDFLALEGGEKNDYIQRVIDDLDVDVLENTGKEGSDFVDIEYKDIDGERAATFLNRLTKLWVEEVIDLDLITLREERKVYQNTRQQTLDKYQATTADLSALISQFELSPTQLFAGRNQQRDEDPYITRINSKNFERDELRLTIVTLKRDVDIAQAEFDAEPADAPTFVAVGAGPSFEAARLAIDAEIDELRLKQAKFLPTNSRWQLIEDLVALKREKLAKLASLSPESSTLPQYPPNPRKEERRRALETATRLLESKQLQLRAIDDQIAELRPTYERRVDALRKAQDLKLEQEKWAQLNTEAELAYQEKERSLKILTEAYGSPYEIVESAQAPEKPSEPNPFLIIAFSLVAGLGLGVGGAFAAEFARGGYRTVNDVTRVLTTPVLGVVNTIVTRREARRQRVVRLTIGMSSAVILLALGWLTYGYALRQDWLGTDLLSRIEDLRTALR